MAGASDALQQGGDRARRTEMADEIDVPDVDTELERGGGDDDRDGARLEPGFGGKAQLARHAAVMGGDAIGTEALAERVRDALHQLPGVDEDDGGAMRADQRRDAVVDLTAQLVAGDRAELLVGRLNAQIERTAMAGVDDRAMRTAIGRETTGADQQARDFIDRLLRRREPDALQPAAGQRVETLHGKRQVRATLVGGDGVNLVDDQRRGIKQQRAAAFGGEQDVERLRGRDEDVWRALDLQGTLARRRIAAAHGDANFGQLHALRGRGGADPGQRDLQVAMNVVAER